MAGEVIETAHEHIVTLLKMFLNVHLEIFKLISKCYVYTSVDICCSEP